MRELRERLAIAWHTWRRCLDCALVVLLRGWPMCLRCLRRAEDEGAIG